MNNLKIYKTLALISLIVELVISFILFGKIRNLILDNNLSVNGNAFYFLIVIILLLVVVLFTITIMLTYKQDKESFASDIKLIEDDTSLKDENANDVSQDELFDIDSYIAKIIPKETSKLDITKYTEKILSNIAKEFNIVQGLFFVKQKEKDIFDISGKYAYFGEEEPKSFKLGESISGQVAKNKTVLNLKDIPENYVTILSGLGSSSPDHLIIVPIIHNNETIGVVELASFKEFKKNFIELFEKISEQMGKALSKY